MTKYTNIIRKSILYAFTKTKYGSLSMPSLRNLNLMKAWDHSNTKVSAKIVQDWKAVFYAPLFKVKFIDYIPSFRMDPVASLINMVLHSFRWQILRCWRLSRLAPQMLRNFGKSLSQISFWWRRHLMKFCLKRKICLPDIRRFSALIQCRKVSSKLSLSFSQHKSQKYLNCSW